MTREYYDLFEYDLALSFAPADRPIAEELGGLLVSHALTVFYDEYTEQPGSEEGVVNHLVNLYARKARYCVILISGNYPLRKWTEAERASARERAYRDASEYILPLRLDDTEVSGLDEVQGTMDLRQQSLENIVSSLEAKLKRTKHRPGPPAKSHDLRSGNVPSTEPKAGTDKT